MWPCGGVTWWGAGFSPARNCARRNAADSAINLPSPLLSRCETLLSSYTGYRPRINYDISESRMAAVLQTQHLGTIQGKSGDGVTQYLGIKYATLKNRLADAIPIDNHEGVTLDATRDG